MPALDDVSADRLRSELATTDDPKAVKRLVIALAYVDGESVATVSERYGIPRSTVYYWLRRFEERSIDEALRDGSRPGRPRKLTDEEYRRLEDDLGDSPTAHGYDVDTWSPKIVRKHIERTYGIAYSTGHVRRLLRDEMDVPSI